MTHATDTLDEPAAADTAEARLARLATVALAHPLSAAELDRLRRAEPSLQFLPADGADWRDALAEADVLLHGFGAAGPVLKADEALRHAPRLAWIHSVSAGVDGLLTPAVCASDVVLTNSRGVHAASIAEHVLALMLAQARALPQLWALQQERRWAPRPWHDSFELQGQTLAVVGLGEIGSALASRAAALGLRVIAVKRQPRAAPPPAGVDAIYGLDLLDAAIADADHVALCLPLTDATRGLFDARRLARLKPGAYLYNIGRGALVDTPALIEALESGRLAGAGLDVTEPEPLPEDAPLWRAPNVQITSHTSGYSVHNTGRTLALLLDNLGRARRRQPLRNRVDKQQGY